MSSGGADTAGPRPAVMIVDDCAATRRLVRLALEREGHVVVEAADGRAALMRAARPRVVLQDMMLPDVDGFALAMELRARSSTRR